MGKAVRWSLVIILVGASGVSAAGPELKTEEQKTLYAIGVRFSQGLAQFNFTEAELEFVKAGITDGVLNKESKVEIQSYLPRMQELQKARVAAVAANQKKAGEAFLDKVATEKGATKTASGLVITTLKPGSGASPKATDKVKVHYTGTLTDGTVFDSSVQRGEPASFPLNGVIPCWTEGVQLMKVGGKAKLVCPAALAYGDRGAPGRIKPGSTLVFEVELLDIVK